MQPEFEVGDLVSYDWRAVKIGDTAPPDKHGIVIGICMRAYMPSLVTVQWSADSVPRQYEPTSLRLVAKGDS